MVDYLCSTHVYDAAFPDKLHLWATPATLFLDRALPTRKEPDAFQRVREISLEQVKSIEIDAISGEHHELRWKATTGFLHKGTTVPSVTGVLVVLEDGEHVLWRMPGKAPIEVQAELGRLMAAVNGRA